MKIFLKILESAIAVLLLLVIAVGLCWWLLPDEELDPAAIEFAALPLPPSTEKNAYFMLWGFGASPELDPHTVGRRIVADHDRILAAQKSLAKFDPSSSAYLGLNPLTFPEGYQFICNAQQEHCLSKYLSSASEIESRSDVYAVWLARYRRLREYEEFGSPMARLSPTTPVVSWQPIMRMAELVDGTIALRMQSPATRPAALEELTAEIRFWRRLLQSNDWLLTQMISVAVLHRKYQSVSDLLNLYPETALQYPALLQEVTEPLSPHQTNITASLRAEHASAFTVMSEPYQLYEVWLKFNPAAHITLLPAYLFAGGYRANASHNLHYQLGRRIVEFYGNSSARTLLAESDAFMRQLAEDSTLTPGALFYNPVGRLELSIAWPNYAQYPLRLYHLIAQSRLLEIQRRLIVEQVHPSQVDSMLATWSPQLDDPFTEQPMRWDTENRRLYFPMSEYLKGINSRWEITTSITLDPLQQ